MKTISPNAYDDLIEHAEVISGTAGKPQVLRLRDGTYAKLFRNKTRGSSARWQPYAVRFAIAARELAERDIPTVHVLDVFHVEDSHDVAVYTPLAGRPLRDGSSSHDRDAAWLPRFARFLAHLHRRGVYFRGVHFGNVLQLEDGRMGLIDVVGTRCTSRPVGLVGRIRNFKPLLRVPEDRALIERFGGRALLEEYVRASNLGRPSAALLVGTLQYRHPLLARDARERPAPTALATAGLTRPER